MKQDNRRNIDNVWVVARWTPWFAGVLLVWLLSPERVEGLDGDDSGGGELPMVVELVGSITESQTIFC